MPNLNILRGASAHDVMEERVEGVDIVAGAGWKRGILAEEGGGEGGSRDGELGHVGNLVAIRRVVGNFLTACSFYGTFDGTMVDIMDRPRAYVGWNGNQ